MEEENTSRRLDWGKIRSKVCQQLLFALICAYRALYVAVLVPSSLRTLTPPTCATLTLPCAVFAQC